jgi:hypothetical protein
MEMAGLSCCAVIHSMVWYQEWGGHTVEGLIRFSRQTLDVGDTRKWIAYQVRTARAHQACGERELKKLLPFLAADQVLHTLHHCHARGVTHGSLHPEFITLSPDLWVTLAGFHCASPRESRPLAGANSEGTVVKSLVERWMARELTNLDYLLALNALAGRRVGDPNFHPVVPWVVEFNQDRTWRDLRRSKSRYPYLALSAATVCADI